eukprot:CAMPEP_0171618484 /NCGR_PEP_ID=MMETSP0990-20121206/14777_1 /TAXON_ID=483369 /ORGANISM="non described non described, Strain CCMP2098" /LENGTH=379 /DNA_ID=CAMNT_0012183303 /DNA_START=55 /DNA_END=1194 /DNA_ORIENTATION=-
MKAEDTVRTTHGACASIIAFTLMAFLFVSEYSFYSTIEVSDRLTVNSTHGEHLKVSFDILFPHIPCDIISLDALDTSGQKQEGVSHHVMKKPIDAVSRKVTGGGLKITGLGTIHKEEDLEAKQIEAHALKAKHVECGNCYGAEASLGDCCDDCQSVREAYRNKGWNFNPDGVAQCEGERIHTAFAAAGAQNSGCQVHGNVDLTTVNGNFHFAPGTATAHYGAGTPMTLQDLISQTFQSFNISHEVTSLSFGNHFPGIMNPLDGQKRSVEDGHGMYQYYIKVVPTVYQYLDGRQVVSNQYSVTEHLRHINPGGGRGLPGVWFFYEVSPVHALFEEERRSSLLEFTSSVCAILGGVFTILGVVDGGVGAVLRRFGSAELGK